MRAPWNQNKNKYVTRSSTFCGHEWQGNVANQMPSCSVRLGGREIKRGARVMKGGRGKMTSRGAQSPVASTQSTDSHGGRAVAASPSSTGALQPRRRQEHLGLLRHAPNYVSPRPPVSLALRKPPLTLQRLSVFLIPQPPRRSAHAYGRHLRLRLPLQVGPGPGPLGGVHQLAGLGLPFPHPLLLEVSTQASPSQHLQVTSEGGRVGILRAWLCLPAPPDPKVRAALDLFVGC